MSTANTTDMSTLIEFSDKSVAAYLGLAIGDALGATVEFLTEPEIRLRYGQHKDITGGGWLRLKPGQVTDDTAMALALGGSILEAHTISAFDIAQAFSDWMKSKPVDIGNTVRRGINNFRYFDIPYVDENEADAGNGACMRTLPIALATLGKNKHQVINSSRIQAHITHNNKLSDAATECIIFCIQALMSGADRDKILQGPVAELLETNPVFDFSGVRMTNPSGYIVDTIKAVFQAFFETNSFEECLVDVVNRGGDADTTGAIAGMLAGAYYGTKEIPRRWLRKLNNNIRLMCEKQATELLLRSKIISVSMNRTMVG